MSTFGDRQIPVKCLQRLASLKPDSPRRWGRMTAHQMVCHLNDAFRGVTGQRPVKSIANPLSRSVIKWVALRSPLPWPKGVATVPEMAQEFGGTPPAEWVSVMDELQRWIETFATHDRFAEHPMFGALSKREWMVWAWRHVDHHFRQFGV